MNERTDGSTNDARARERQELRCQMAIQHRVELEMNSLIQGMVKLVDQESKVTQGRMDKTQLKNLLAVALETSSVEVVKHYILYQVGRDTAGTSWRQDDFGKKLARAIDDLYKTADRVTAQAHKDLRLPDPCRPQIDRTWALLVRAYVGQLNRYFYYRKEGGTPWLQATS